ncbi:MAG: protein kinase, partial [Acidobacteriia bacterium]|nr:protein kinase [Terriglobia bacterium]
MTPERWRRLEELFHAAAALPEAERSAYLERECRDDNELRHSVQMMLDQKGSSLLDSSFLTQTSATSTGRQMGSYRLESKLGEGGMGEVFAALDTRLNRRVAIKLCREKFSDRFQREALALSALNHPHICTLFDVGPDYLVMEFVEGTTLAARIAEGALPVEELIRYGSEIADALAEAHARGIIHRDLKPANIMVTRHGAKVLDFGLAKMSSQADVTERNVVIGTPAYMAPEQFEGREIDARADLFALGLVLYEMAVGILPFPGIPLGRLLLTGPRATIPTPTEKRRGIPSKLDAIVTRLLDRDPAHRYLSAADVRLDLKALVESSRPAPPRRTLIAAAVIFVGIVALAGFFLSRQFEHRRWARDEAIPQIAALRSQKKDLAAFLLLRRAQEYLPGDAQLAELEHGLVRSVSIHSTPPGAKVEIQDYLAPDGPWYTVGSADLNNAPIPGGYFRWRVSKPQFATFIAAPETEKEMQFALVPVQSVNDMVSVPAGAWGDMIDFIGWIGYKLPAFDVDRLEVTNRQFQQFVDQGGYRKPEYWKEKFMKDGRELKWAEAMELFRDPTGRPGPSTWEGGH